MRSFRLLRALKMPAEDFDGGGPVLSHDGGAPAAHAHVGAQWLKRGQAAQAAQAFEAAVRLRPEWPEAHNALSVALRLQGRLDGAIWHCREAVRLAPEMAEAHNNLGSMLTERSALDNAIASLREAIRLKPDFANAYSNFGIALYRQHRYAEAVAAYREAIAHNPALAEAHNNLGSALFDLGKVDDALESFAEAIRLEPDYREAHWGRALAWLSRGEYERGWPELEWRLTPDSRLRKPPRWTGESLAGRTVLLEAEQGLGDTLQFVRYASLVRRRGGRVVLACQPRLVSLLAAGCRALDQVVSQYDARPSVDVYAPLLSLPGIFQTTLPTVPAEVPYLNADPLLVDKWRSVVSGLPGFKIGIAWQGNPQYHGDQERSFPLAEFEPLAHVPGVRLVSLQQGQGAEQLRAGDRKFPVVEFDQLDEAAGPFMDTAAIINSLDLVITCDSAIGHLAGALGMRAWVAIPAVADWRWLQNRDDSPSYPTLRLFRQEKIGDWKGVFQRIAATFAAMASSKRS